MCLGVNFHLLCRCRRSDGDLPLHDWRVRLEVPWRVQQARSGLDGQRSVPGHRLFGHAVHRGVSAPTHLPHPGEVHLHRVPIPVPDTRLAAHRHHPAGDLGVWLCGRIPATRLQRPVPQLLWHQRGLLPASLRAARDTVGSRLFHCHFPR